MRKQKQEKIKSSIEFRGMRVNPAPMSYTYETFPKIAADYTSYKNEIDALSVRMFINDAPVPATIEQGKIEYKPKHPLEHGRYDVKVTFLYNGESCEKEWNFNIIKHLKKEKYYFGITHCHTEYSTGKGMPKDAYKYGYNNKLDYMIITDHMRKLSQHINIEDSKKIRITLSRWDATTYEAAHFRKKHKKFTPLQGYEMGVTLLGHINIYNSREVCKKKIKTINDLIEYLEEEKDAFICINHPNKKVLNVPYIEKLDKYMQLIEVGNGTQNNYKRYTDIYFEMLDNGWHIGAINGQDNHKDDWGDEDNLTGIIGHDGKETDILEAMKERRVYSTEVRDVRLSFKINGYHMGSKINVESGEKVEVSIKFKSKSVPISKVEVISNRGEVIESFNCTEKKDGDFKIFLKKHEYEKWYVVRLIHIGNFETISSPIFI